jgi:hypothetical protein
MKMRSMIFAGAMVMAAQITSAAPITGNIGFFGNATLNGGMVETATEVLNWSGAEVGNSGSGSFTNIARLTAVALSSPWPFKSGPIANFWSVGGFTLNLKASSIFSVGGGFLNIVLSGTVSGNGYDPTPFSGTFQVADPAANGNNFTARLSFAPAAPPPNLAIMANGTNNLKILWPEIGLYFLQQNSDLTTTNWEAANYTITNDFETNYCIVTPLTNHLFFRLSE